LETLVKAGQRDYPDIQIKQASILDKEIIARSSIDVITVLGVISIFDDIDPIVKNLAHWIKPGGKILIHGMFNPLDVDVFVKYRRSDEHEIGPFEAGWNVVSQKTVTKLFTESGAKQVQFHDFRISIDLERDFEDPLRSWTEKLADGTRQIINAT
jgi:SAM-dependent methyltransferase